jgi:hypothetical protein
VGHTAARDASSRRITQSLPNPQSFSALEIDVPGKQSSLPAPVKKKKLSDSAVATGRSR